MKNAIRLRVSVVLKYWVGKQFTDLDEEMIAKVYDFVDNTLTNDGYDDLAAMLKKEITSKVHCSLSLSLSLSLSPLESGGHP